MAKNFPGPYEVRINYTASVSGVIQPHQQRLNCNANPAPNVGDDFSTIEIVLRSGVTQNLQLLVDQWITVLRPLYAVGASEFVNAELWQYTPLTTDAQFISAYSIGLAGTAVGNTFAAGQTQFTFRSQEGGVLRINLMESIIPQGGSRGFAAMTAEQQAISTFVTQSGAPWLARDTSYPFALIAMHPGQNEAVFKNRYR